MGFRWKFSIMLAAQLAFLALYSQSSGVPLSPGYQRSSPVPISTALLSGELRRSRLGGCGFLGSAERVRPQVGFQLSQFFLQYPVLLHTFAMGRYSVAFAEQCSLALNSMVLVSSGLLIPQFLLGSRTVVTDSLVCRNHVIESG